MSDIDPAVQIRLHRLERSNRLLTALSILSIATVLLALAGWRTPGHDPLGQDGVMRVRRLEVVDSRGVPLVAIGTDRTEEGGSIVLRDKLGEKRSWWQAGPRKAEITLSSADEHGENDTTLGFTVAPDLAKVLLIGKGGAILSEEMGPSGPRLELLNDSGKSVFSAPWKGNR